MPLIGPAPAASIGAWMDRLHEWMRVSRVEIVGRERLLGRNSVVIEYGETSTYDRGDGTMGLTGLGRMWVDPETMLILRHETDNGRFVLEVTTLEWRPRLDATGVSFVLPADAVDSNAPGGSRDGPPGPPWARPGAILVATALGDLEELRMGSQYDSDGQWSVVFDYGTPSQEGHPAEVLARLFEVRRADGLPAPLKTGTPVDIAGRRRYLTISGATISIAWEEQGIAVLFTGDGIPLDQVVAIVASVVPGSR